MAGVAYDRLGVLQKSGRSLPEGKYSNVYVFKNNEIFEEEVNTDSESTFRPRNKKVQSSTSKKTEQLYVKRQIAKDETLQSIALKYSCQVTLTMSILKYFYILDVK